MILNIDIEKIFATAVKDSSQVLAGKPGLHGLQPLQL